MRLKVKVTGLDRLQRQLQRLGRDWPREIEKGGEKALYYVWGEIPPYPPPPPDSTYRRTGTLGRTLTTRRGRTPGALGEVRAFAEQIRIVAGSAIPYADLVVGAQQARVHRERWWKLTTVVKDVMGDVTRILQQATNAALRRIFKA
jgi:hypothetical protein